MAIPTRDAEVSRHKCLVYDGDPAEQLPVVVPLLLDGLRDNWRCVYMGSPDTVSMIDAALTAKGVDTARERDRAALVFSSERSHLREGKFDPEAMIASLRASVDEATADGFQGLCATGDMRWELGTDESFERLLEYEALLEQVIRDKPLRGICQYHRALVPGEAVRDALVTHRSTYVGSQLNADNIFYVPPEILLEARRGGPAGAKHAEWMCQQILRVIDAERARDTVLRELEARVAARTAELDVANRQLRAFSYSVSHDLRAPLRAIQGFGAELAEQARDDLSTDAKASLDRVLDAATRMDELIEGMMVLGGVVEREMRRTEVDLSMLAQSIAGDLQRATPTRKVELGIQRGLRTLGDPVLLNSALQNLIANAWKFTAKREGARIDFGRDPSADTPTFFVRDNGAGFDMKHAERLFSPFQRLHRQEDFAGTGVGLATVERIVARHGGRIWVEAAPEQGATFYFTLPGEDA